MRNHLALTLFILPVLLTSCASPNGSRVSNTNLRFVATARQVGPVAYRDPLGAISPDGRWVAYTSDRFVDVIPSSGGPIRRLGPGKSDLRQLTWTDNSEAVAVLERSYDRATEHWYRYDIRTGIRSPLWKDGGPNGLIQLAWPPTNSPAGNSSIIAGILRSGEQTLLVRIDAGTGAVTDTVATDGRISFPAWMPDGSISCLVLEGEGQSLQMPCGEPSPGWAHQVYGPVSFSSDSTTLYFSTPDERRRLDVWARNLADGGMTRISSFDRDAYAPSSAADGTLLFKSQDYRVFIAMADAEGGESVPVTTFQSETPMWDWSSTRISFTWGDWRRQTDDIYYPDISQNIGFLDMSEELPASQPSVVVRQSRSEDQSMHWSPNGKWIVFHSHVDGDDIWLVPADGSAPARQMTNGGRETGWPRWSPDGRWIQYPSYRRLTGGGRRSDLFLIGIDQETGTITSPSAAIDMGEFQYDAQQGEWLGGSDEIVFESASGPGAKMIYRVPRTGGRPTLVHRFSSPQVFSGISASPDGRWIAYVAPAPDGWLQIYRVRAHGGTGEPLTFDPTDKTQPAYSPDGTRIAFTVFSYSVHFWAVD